MAMRILRDGGHGIGRWGAAEVHVLYIPVGGSVFCLVLQVEFDGI